MRKVFYLIASLFTVLLASITFGQSPPTPDVASREHILEYRIEGNELEYLTTTQTLSRALNATRVPGGMVRIVDCQQDEAITQRWQPLGVSLRNLLDSMVTADPQYRWHIDSGVVNIMPTMGEPALLKSRVDNFDAENVTSADAALYKLLALPEIKGAIARLGLNEGLKIIVKPIPLKPSSNTGYTVRCKNTTLREALNAIARAHGRAVWLYRERHCDGKDEFFIDFIVE